MYSKATAHMAYTKTLLLKTEKVSPFEVEIGAISSVMVHGRATVHFMLSVNESYQMHSGKCSVCNKTLATPPTCCVMDRARNSVSIDEGKCLNDKN